MSGRLVSLWLYKEVKKEVVVPRGKFRCVSRVFQNFKVKIYQYVVRNGRLVRSSIVLKKQDSFRKPKTYQHPYVYIPSTLFLKEEQLCVAGSIRYVSLPRYELA
jgi:hypothetical protein